MVAEYKISSLPIGELSALIEEHPWFAIARKLLCERLASLGRDSDALYAETALHLPSRSVVAGLSHSPARLSEFEDSTLSITERKKQEPKVIVIGGDYFTQDEYDGVRKEEDGAFPRFASGESDAPIVIDSDPDEADFFYTETLAGIYLEQGYVDMAREIYSKLSLRYPEKSVYFAALIDRLDKK